MKISVNIFWIEFKNSSLFPTPTQDSSMIKFIPEKKSVKTPIPRIQVNSDT